MRTAKLFFAKIIFLLTFFQAPFAFAIPTVDCMAWTHNQQNNDFSEAPLKKTNYDPDYYETKLSQYTMGADFSYLPQEGIGLIVYDNKSKRFTSNTVGFRRIGDTKNYEATLSYYDFNAAGETVVAGVQCGYRAP